MALQTRNTRLSDKIKDVFGGGSNKSGQQAFANKLGISKQAVSHIVCMRRPLSSDNKLLWAKALKCNVLDLWRRK